MGAPLFILSFRHRDELTRLAESGGWQAIAARRAENVEARFVASGAAIAVIDARGEVERWRCPMIQQTGTQAQLVPSKPATPARHSRFHL